MQTVLDAASHIAQEIEKTRLHLANLEQALAALRPLISVPVGTPSLTFNAPADIQTVEDVSVVRTTRKKPTTKTKATAKKVTSTKVAVPKTGSPLWLKCMGRKKLTVNELADLALLKLDLGPEARSTLHNRAGAWLNSLMKKKQITVTVGKDGLNLYQLVKE